MSYVGMNRYIGCSIIISDKENRVLIAQRSSSKKTYPLHWEVIGGALEKGETPEACIRREVQEEINCKIYDLKLFKVYSIEENDNRHLLIVYTGEIRDVPRPNIEIEVLKWICEVDINTYNFMGNDRQKIIDYWGASQETKIEENEQL